ncbi:hypothetical protein CF319_g4114 [Tilletia indica]|nr:hypothetical protein CF319_g4114 [Tilletia indica]
MSTAEKQLSRHARKPRIATHRQSVDLININPALFTSSRQQQQPRTTTTRTIAAEKRLSRHARNPRIASHRQSVDLMSLKRSIFTSPQHHHQSFTSTDGSPTVELIGFDDVHGPEAMDKRASTTLISNATYSTPPRTPSTPASSQVSPFVCPRSPHSPFRDSLRLTRLGSEQQDGLLAAAHGGETASTHHKAVQNKPHQTSQSSK